MLIWAIILGIFVILGVSSYYKGAIRSLVSLLGLLVALFLTKPLAPLLKPLVPMVGLAHPLWAVLIPQLVAFLLIVAVFTGLGFFVHQKVALHFKYSTDDYSRLRWERLNHRLGLCVGLYAGAIYSVLVCAVIYVTGYPLVGVTSAESPTMQRLLAQAREDLHTTGLDKTLASLDGMDENYYLTSDTLALLYGNGAVLQDRLDNYPAFLTLSERPELKEIATDTDLQQLIQTAGPAVSLVKHPKILAVVNNAEIVEQLKQVDLKDLYNYLRTGKSEKYGEEKILGRWKLDPSATLVSVKRKNPDMSVAEMRRLKDQITIFLPKTTLMVTPDKQAFLRIEMTEQAKKLIEDAQARVKAVADATANGDAGEAAASSSLMAQRYGLRPRAPATPAAPAAGSAAAQPGMPEMPPSLAGTWSRDGIKYKLALKDDKGHEQTADAIVDGDRLIMTVRGQPTVMVR